MRLLILTRYGRLGASSRVRFHQYLEPLKQHGIAADVEPLLPDQYVKGLYSARRPSFMLILSAYVKRIRALLHAREFDVIWLEKEAFPWLPAVLERSLFSSGVPVVVDYDDALFHRYDRHSSALVRSLLGAKIDSIMRGADCVTAGNNYLAERARSAGCKRVELLPTVVDLARYPAGESDLARKQVVVGWIGSPATAKYLELIKPVAAELSAGGQVKFVAIGARRDQVVGSAFEPLEWTEASEVRLLGALDVGVMPLVDDAWERGKCGYKLIQYMACARPVIASPVGVNTSLIEDGVNGFLCGPAHEWKSRLLKLIEDPGLRLSMGRAGREKVERVYSVEAQTPRLVGLLRRVRGGL